VSSINVINIKHPSASSNAITLAADGSAFINTGVLGSRNRIINGDMRIDQRYGGTLLTGAGNPNYLCDRFGVYHNIGTLNYQQNLNSVTPPNGFSNYLGLVNTSASTSAATNYYNLFQAIEGFNIADLGWGTASASSVTLSFWVRSSIAGTYSATLNTAGNSYGYPATYSISQANTWTYVTITYPGLTTGTINTTNGNGISVIWDLGQGSNYRFTPGSWQSGTVQGATGSTNWNQTNGATFYITGVQLEAGTVATAFERRSYGQELALCHRYFQKRNFTANGWIVSASKSVGNIQFAVPFRANPGSATFHSGSIGYGPGGQQSISSMDAPGLLDLDYFEAGFNISGGMTTNAGSSIRATVSISAEL
jgi:hypothetical protein